MINPQVNIFNDMKVAYGIAIRFSPYDTGNLRLNAIKTIIRPDGFTIRYSLDDAFYIYFLEEGTKYTKKHMGFIANKTVPAIANYLFYRYSVAKNDKITRQWQRFSRQGVRSLLQHYEGYDEKLEKRHLGSLVFDLAKVSKEQQWQHNPNIEVYDPYWRRSDFL